MTNSKKTKTQQIVFMAVLIAINIILSRFLSISAWNLKIGFSFVPVAIAALYLGTWQAGAVAAIGDFLGANLFPIASYYPGFTLSAFLTGIFYGLFLRQKPSFVNIFCSVLLSELICSLLLNSLWISILSGSPYLALLLPRLFQAGVMIIIKCFTIRLLVNYIPVLRQHTI